MNNGELISLLEQALAILRQSKTRYKVALVIGHNAVKQGAVNTLGETEWVFNQRVAVAVNSRASFRVERFLRPPNVSYGQQVRSVIKQLENYKPDLVVCMHFNGGNASGTEALIYDINGNQNSYRFADILTDVMNEEYGLVERHSDGVLEISGKHNGTYMLKKLHEAGYAASIIEPAFNSNFERDKAVFEDVSRYANTIVKAIDKYFEN